MTRYTDITNDYVKRSLTNYVLLRNKAPYPFTLAIETLQAISMAIYEQDTNCSTGSLLEAICHLDKKQDLKQFSFFNTDSDYKECFRNIRNGVSHMIDGNYEYINSDKSLSKFIFSCDQIRIKEACVLQSYKICHRDCNFDKKCFKEIEEDSLNNFLTILLSMLEKT